MESIENIQQNIVKSLSQYSDLFDIHQYIIEQAGDCPVVETKYKVDENAVGGCQAEVWLRGELKNGRLQFTADSDALIVKGLLAMVLKVVNQQRPADVARADLDFLEVAGITSHLSPVRSVGLGAIISRIRSTAEAYL